MSQPIGQKQNDTLAKRGEILATDVRLVPTGPEAKRPGEGSDTGPAVEPVVEPAVEPVDWQTAMRRAIRSGAELRARLGLERYETPGGSEPHDRDVHDARNDRSAGERAFPTFVPLEFLARMRPGDPDDPLLRQVMATPEESADAAGFVSDPVGDRDALGAGGLLHKYAGRSLLISTGACGVHCRYCFRREFPYREVGSRDRRWRAAIDEIARRPEIEEVLLSGGDPLTLVDDVFAELVEAIATIGHVRRLRVHTRMPVVIPQRVTSRLVDVLAGNRLAVWFVIHVNHPNELDASVMDSLSRLIDRGIPVLNQAVLLRGVNDDVETLIALSRRLIDHRITPYYLHQLDRVRGAAHFEVSEREGLRLVRAMREALPGYAVPKYVRETAGERSKSPIEQSTTEQSTTEQSTTEQSTAALPTTEVSPAEQCLTEPPSRPGPPRRPPAN